MNLKDLPIHPWAKTFIEVLLLIVLVVGSYYNLDGRITMNAHRVGEEIKGYQSLVGSLGIQLQELRVGQQGINQRLSRIEGRLDMTRRTP